MEEDVAAVEGALLGGEHIVEQMHALEVDVIGLVAGLAGRRVRGRTLAKDGEPIDEWRGGQQRCGCGGRRWSGGGCGGD